jgi:rRNA maturation endonuclease Nob1
MKPIKCPHCKKIFFDIGSDSCPFCGKNLKIFYLDEDNPLKDIFDIFGDPTNEKN